MVQSALWWRILTSLALLALSSSNFVGAETIVYTVPQQEAIEVDDPNADDRTEELPALLSQNAIADYFSKRDLDGLHIMLKRILNRSLRNPDANVDNTTAHDMLLPPSLPQILNNRGSGWNYTTAYKLQHDIEQALYIEEVLMETDRSSALYYSMIVAPYYSVLLAKLSGTEPENGLYYFDEYDISPNHFDRMYNVALYQPRIKQLRDATTGENVPILNPFLDVATIQEQWTTTGMAVIDHLLTDEALAALQRIMWESTVWFQTTKHPVKDGGYVGAYLNDGLHDRILLQLALDLADLLPGILNGLTLHNLWAFKYDSNYTGTKLHNHPGSSTVNINVWLTPDEANLDPATGGMVVYDTTNEEAFYREKRTTIPYRMNRAVIFDPRLLHYTDKFTFQQGYLNRRINLSLLFGEHSKPEETPSADDVASSQEDASSDDEESAEPSIEDVSTAEESAAPSIDDASTANTEESAAPSIDDASTATEESAEPSIVDASTATEESTAPSIDDASTATEEPTMVEDASNAEGRAEPASDEKAESDPLTDDEPTEPSTEVGNDEL